MVAVAAITHIAYGVGDRPLRLVDSRAERGSRRLANALLRKLESGYTRQGLGLLDLATDCGIPRTEASRFLVLETGARFREHVNCFRLLHAIRGAAAGHLIRDVAIQAGYRDTKELDRQCGKIFGLPPTSLQMLIQALPPTIR